MELKAFSIVGSVALAYHPKVPTMSWILLIPSGERYGDVSSGFDGCVLLPYWIGSALAGACWGLAGLGCWYLVNALLTKPGTMVSSVLCL